MRGLSKKFATRAAWRQLFLSNGCRLFQRGEPQVWLSISSPGRQFINKSNYDFWRARLKCHLEGAALVKMMPRLLHFAEQSSVRERARRARLSCRGHTAETLDCILNIWDYFHCVTCVSASASHSLTRPPAAAKALSLSRVSAATSAAIFTTVHTIK